MLPKVLRDSKPPRLYVADAALQRRPGGLAADTRNHRHERAVPLLMFQRSAVVEAVLDLGSPKRRKSCQQQNRRPARVVLSPVGSLR